MKIKYFVWLSMILMLSNLLLMYNASYGQSESVSGMVLFMKSHSTGSIVMKYVKLQHNSTVNTKRGIYDSSLQEQNPLILNDLTIQSEPKIIDTEKNNTVTYTIVAKNNVKGIYAIQLTSSCGFSPLIVGLNESDISIHKLFKFFTAVYNCPAISDQTPHVEIISYENITSKDVVITQDQLSPLEQSQFGMFRNIQCKQGFTLITKSTDGSPACVKTDTSKILIERGWAKTLQ